MAIKNFDEILRQREEQASRQNDGTVHLDDESRVKVLSPTQMIIKRFMRNRLAIVGLVILAVMFFFSFVGPFFSPYGETEVFYKHHMMNLPYAQASRRDTYIIYDANEQLPTDIRLSVTVTANKLNAVGATIAAQSITVDGAEQSYLFELKHEGIESVSLLHPTEVEDMTFSSVTEIVDRASLPVVGIKYSYKLFLYSIQLLS